MKSPIRLLFILFVFLTSFEGHASLPEQFHFRHYSIENGISSNGIAAILQDSKGYIWFGTDNGLNRFDGTQFKFYQKSDPLYQNFQFNTICTLCEAKENEIWVGTECGIYIYDQKKDKFTLFEQETHQKVKIDSWVNYIIPDKENNIWIATQRQGVFQYNPHSNKLIQFDIPQGNGNIVRILSDEQNNIWATGMNNLYRLNKVTNTFEDFKIEGEENGVYSMALWEDNMHHIWIGTWKDGLWKLDPNTHKVEKFLTPESGKAVAHIHSILEYAPNILFIGSDDGLMLFNTLTHESKLHTYYGEESGALSGKFIYPMIKDREGGVWIGTFYNGVNYLPPYCGQFKGYPVYKNNSLFSSKIISRFCEDAQGNVWIGSDDNGLSRFSPVTGEFVDFPGRKQLQSENIHALCAVNNHLWIGTYSNGIHVLNMQTGQIKTYSVQDGLDDISIYSIFKDSHGSIWTGSMSGICRYDSEQDSFIPMKKLESLIIEITEDVKGNLWIATLGKGVFKYNPFKDIWKKYDQEQGFSNPNINHLCIDKERRLWAATPDGLYCYQTENDCFVYQPLHLQNECINTILEGDDCLWLTTAKGLVKYIPTNQTTQIFTKSDGLQSEAFIMASGIKTRNGEFYIGSINGFNTFYPHQLKLNTQKPTVVLTGLEIFNQNIQTKDEGILPLSIDHLDEIHLSYKHNVITLSYAALSYCTPQKNKYAYMLEGFDKRWNFVNSQHNTTYTNLAAGTYTFRVKASNNDNIWNEQGTSIRIIVHPPFYLSLPFKIFYFLLFCFAIAMLIRYVSKRSEKKHAIAISELNANKEKEMHEAKIKFFTMIAHEIRTPVSLIIGPLEKIMQATLDLPDQIRKDLEIIDRNSQRLLYLVNQLLDFRKVEQNEMTMHFSSQNIKNLMQAVCERFQPSMKQRNITLFVTYPVHNFKADVDREALTKVLSNLLTNANKYTTDKVEVKFIHQPNHPTFSIQVTDNGKGMEEEELRLIFKPFYQASENKPGTGIGLSIVKGIVEAHHGLVEVESCPGVGSTFRIQLPVRQETVEKDAMQPAESIAVPEDIITTQIEPTDSQTLPVMLIAEDNEDMLNFLQSNFKSTYTVLTATDGKEALRLLEEQEVSLIISDWMMPNMNGVEFCQAIRSNQLTSHIPFILLTAKTDNDSKITGMNCGADAYIEKPFSIQYLEACIKNLLELRQQLRQKFSQMPNIPLSSITGNKADEEFLKNMNQLIEDNFSNANLSIDFLSEKLCISRSGLFSKIKILANMTPNEMVQLVRLKKAADLLRENKYRINEISYMVGFSNPAYFSRCFQKQFGVKPSEFIGSEQNTDQAGQMGAEPNVNHTEQSSTEDSSHEK